jgi:hypothetical protein
LAPQRSFSRWARDEGDPFRAPWIRFERADYDFATVGKWVEVAVRIGARTRVSKTRPDNFARRKTAPHLVNSHFDELTRAFALRPARPSARHIGRFRLPELSCIEATSDRTSNRAAKSKV